MPAHRHRARPVSDDEDLQPEWRNQIAIALPEQQPFGPNTVTLLPILQVETNVPLRPLSDDGADENNVQFQPASYQRRELPKSSRKLQGPTQQLQQQYHITLHHFSPAPGAPVPATNYLQ
jgi:hypothetical protein